MVKRDVRNFSPEKFAKLDADMWRAYYRHEFLKLFVLLIRLCNNYCSPNFILTLRSAYHSAAAAVIFRKTKGQEDHEKILLHLQKFYKLLSDHNIEPFDYLKAAELELQWWYVDRYPKRYKQSRAEALAAGVTPIFNIALRDAKVYGRKREAAMLLIGDHHHNKAVTPDWAKIQSLLTEAYQSLHNATRPSA